MERGVHVTAEQDIGRQMLLMYPSDCSYLNLLHCLDGIMEAEDAPNSDGEVLQFRSRASRDLG
jgi:hypothetical protein